MNQILTPDQIRDLAAIRKICDEMGADVVVIGATALLLSIGDIGRFTRTSTSPWPWISTSSAS